MSKIVVHGMLQCFICGVTYSDSDLVIEAKGLNAADLNSNGANTSDPFVEVQIKGESARYRTEIINKDSNPHWDEQFEL